ncbi:MAG: DUF551 domain-containing protein [Trichococcus flocculiformis]|uniref:DUF551 domain-containing protein n=1 Tax=Trichococcus flocculiformis TaxID=82803 RepID=A0A847D7M6_9LACT|nr:hypothetical protein [Trichococcus flocculiformis]NLD33072.1 DUF551 domain-containing protein [Trichococcus flocculiformis]
MTALIDAEIARQSVKSEDVQEAIEQLQSEYVDDFEGYPASCGKWNRNIDLAIAALQEYRPCAKVSEGLPPENELRNGMVLAWSTELDEWQVENWGYVENRPDDYTHWKPLPEPPEGE